MSQFIVLGTNEIKNNTSDTIINNLQINSLLYSTNDNKIAGIVPPQDTSNNILQYDPETKSYYWKELTLSTITGNKETTAGILWNDSTNYLRMMSANEGVYNVLIQNNKYQLTPATTGNVSIAEGTSPNSLVITGPFPNSLIGIPSNKGYLYYDDLYNSYLFKYPVETLSAGSGLVYWDSIQSQYKGVAGTNDGVYALSKTGSSVVNITQKDGFLIASNKNVTALGYPTSSGEYSLLVDNELKMSWKKKEIVPDKVQDIVVTNPLVNGEILTTVGVAGDYLVTFDFVAMINILNLPSPQGNFQDFIDKCPMLEIVNVNPNESVNNGKVMLQKIFTGPLTYDYFSFTVLQSFMENATIQPKWTNNTDSKGKPIVSIETTNMTMTYVETVEGKYEVDIGTSANLGTTGVITTLTYTGKIMVNLSINLCVDLIKTPSTSQIKISFGNNVVYVRAVPPVAEQYYSLNRIFNVQAGDIVSIVSNESNFVEIKNYNLIINKL